MSVGGFTAMESTGTCPSGDTLVSVAGIAETECDALSVVGAGGAVLTGICAMAPALMGTAVGGILLTGAVGAVVGAGCGYAAPIGGTVFPLPAG